MIVIREYQREVERNYEFKEWQRLNGVPPGSTSLSTEELYPFCSSSSQRFHDLLSKQRGEEAILLDYELLNLGHDILSGCLFSKSPGGKIILTVCTEDGNVHYIEV